MTKICKAGLILVLACACAAPTPKPTGANPPPADPGAKPADAGAAKPAPAAGKTSDPGQQLAFHVAAIVKAVLADPDCGKALASALAYIESNRAEMKDQARRLKEKDQAMTDEAREQYLAQVMKLVEELVPKAEESMKAFQERCPEQDEQISNALSFMDEE